MTTDLDDGFYYNSNNDKYSCEMEIDGKLYVANVRYKFYEGRDSIDMTHPYLVVADGYYYRFLAFMGYPSQEDFDYYLNDTNFYIFPLILAD